MKCGWPSLVTRLGLPPGLWLPSWTPSAWRRFWRGWRAPCSSCRAMGGEVLKAARKARMGMGWGYIVFYFFKQVFIVFRGVQKNTHQLFSCKMLLFGVGMPP